VGVTFLTYRIFGRYNMFLNKNIDFLGYGLFRATLFFSVSFQFLLQYAREKKFLMAHEKGRKKNFKYLSCRYDK